MLGVTQFVMRKAKIVRTADQIHASFQCLQAVSRMTTFARESRNRSRIVPLNRSIKAVLSTVPPIETCNSSCACSSVPSVIFRTTSTTRFCSVRLMTVAIHSWDHICKHARPRPAVRLTFSRNAR